MCRGAWACVAPAPLLLVLSLMQPAYYLLRCSSAMRTGYYLRESPPV